MKKHLLRVSTLVIAILCFGMTNSLLAQFDGGYKDADGDGWGDINSPCSYNNGHLLPGCTHNVGDCDDSNPLVNNGIIFYLDVDGDGYYLDTYKPTTDHPCPPWPSYRYPGQTVYTVDGISTYAPIALGDCDDNNYNANPKSVWYHDVDMDGYAIEVAYQCAKPSGNDWYYENQVIDAAKGINYHFNGVGDCDDNNSAVYALKTFYVDKDGDGYVIGNAYSLCAGSAAVPGYTESSQVKGMGDCDDNNASVYLSGNLYLDADNDGYTVGPFNKCYGAVLPAGYSLDAKKGTDCDDSNPLVWRIGLAYVDKDGDFYSADGNMVSICLGDDNYNPPGYVVENYWSGIDCNDNDKTVFATKTWYIDKDKDNFTAGSITICSGATPPTGYTTDFSAGPDCDDNDPNLTTSKVVYIDKDGDGYDNGSDTICLGYSLPAGYNYATRGHDCNDNDPLVHSMCTYYVDADGDGYAGNSTPIQLCCSASLPGYTFNSTLDCDDSNPAVYQSVTLYRDADGDFYDDGTGPHVMCIGASIPAGYSTSTYGTDCDDTNRDIFPGSYPRNWTRDADGDGFGTLTDVISASCRPAGYVEQADISLNDCNDTNKYINPNTVWYLDADNDGYSTGDSIKICTPPAGYRLASALKALKGDCRDDDPLVYPGSVKQSIWYKDNDHDGYGDSTKPVIACIRPAGYVADNTDCNDADSLINPGEKWYIDADNDGYAPAAFVTGCYSPGASYKTASSLKGLQVDCNDNNPKIYPLTPTPTTAWSLGYPVNGYINYYKDLDHDNSFDKNPYTATYDFPSTWYPSCDYVAESQLGRQLYEFDCDDTDPEINQYTNLWYKDLDNDGYGDGTFINANYMIYFCNPPQPGYKRKKSLIAISGDCNDNDSTIHPGSMVGQQLYYRDNDGDGYGDKSITKLWCSTPVGYVSDSTDCNDANALINPGTKWYQDKDGDGFGNAAVYIVSCEQPVGYVNNKLDCDDTNSLVNPTYVFYKDADNDGYSDGTVAYACTSTALSGYKSAANLIAINGDCDDNNALLNPATVWYQDKDNDGYPDGVTIIGCSVPANDQSIYKLASQLISLAIDCNPNDSLINPATVWYQDKDGDGYGNPLVSLVQCTQPTGYVLNNTDCNDSNPLINPKTIWYLDKDGDGFGVNTTTQVGCIQPAGYAIQGNDCDDTNPLIYPTVLWYHDKDGDGYGDASDTTKACTQPIGYVSDKTDCNDTNAAINPATKWYQDLDGDGYGNSAVFIVICQQPTGYVLAGGDCNDTNAVINPATIWYKDADNDGYSDGTTLTQCTQPTGYKLASELIALSGDCDDNNAALHSSIPPLTVTSDAGNCAGSGMINFTASHENAPGTFSYQWYLNGSAVGSNQLNYSASGLSGVNSIYCIMQLNGQCKATSNIYTQTIVPTGSISTASACSELANLVLNNVSGIDSILWMDNNVVVNSVGKDGSAITTTVAAGVNNGQGAAANQLYRPQGIAIDNDGNVYVADTYNNRIQVFAPGSTNGVALPGVFNNPADVFIDKKGNIYVSNAGSNNVVMAPNGSSNFTVVAGNNGQGAAANQFSMPQGIFVDDTGNVYVSDRFNDRIQKWAPGASEGVTVAGGNGEGNAANQFFRPQAVALDSAGNIYVADLNNNRLQKWTPGATQGISMAGGENPYGYSNVAGVNFDGHGNLLVATRYDAWKVNVSTGQCTNVLHDVNLGPVAVTSDNSGSIYVLGSSQYSPNGGEVRKLDYDIHPSNYMPGTSGVFSARIVSHYGCSNQTNSINVNAPSIVYYRDYDGDGYSSGDSIVNCFAPSGYYLAGELKATKGDCNDSNAAVHQFVNFSLSSSQQNCAIGAVTITANVTSSGLFNYQWSLNQSPVGTTGATYMNAGLTGSNTISCLVTSNEYCATTASLTQTMEPSESLIATSGTCLGNSGLPLQLGVTDDIAKIDWKYGDAITKSVTFNGPQLDTLLLGTSYYTGSGPNKLYDATQFVFDSTGNMYIADFEDNRIQQFAPGSSMGITVAGGNGFGGAANQLAGPASVALDKQGNIYVADKFNNRIQLFTPGSTNGVTLLPNYGISTTFPYSIVFDADGNLVVSCTDRIFKFNLTTHVATDIYYANNDKIIRYDKHNNLYISDLWNSRILKIDSGSTTANVIIGAAGAGSGPNQLQNPAGIEFDEAGNLLVADQSNQRIQKFSPGDQNGTTLINLSTYPSDLHIDKISKKLLVLELYSLERYNLTINGNYNVSLPGNYSATVTSSGGCSYTSNIITISSTPHWYRDADGDLMGMVGTDSISCSQPVGYVNNSFDCNDSIAQPFNQHAEIVVYGNSKEILYAVNNPNFNDSTDFGYFCNGSTKSLTKTFKISNPGKVALNISSIRISGPDSAQFSILNAPTTIDSNSTFGLKVVYTPNAIGTHNATITINNDNCSKPNFSFGIRAAVHNLPVVSASIFNSYRNGVCLGYTISLQGSGAATYLWSDSITDNVGFSPSVSKRYFVVGSNLDGCSDTSSVFVDVITPPIGSISATDTVLCLGSAVTLTGHGGYKPYCYWNNGITDSVAFTPSTTNTYTYYVWDQHLNCRTSVSQTVRVVNLPTVSVSATDTMLCFGMSTTIHASGANSYVFSNGIQNDTAFKPFNTSTYLVIGTDSNNCKDTARLKITVNQLPVVKASVNYPKVCRGASLILKGEGASTYTWSDGKLNDVAFVPTADTTYYVKGTDVNGCMGKDSIYVSIVPVHPVNVTSTYSPSNGAICVNSSVVLNAQADSAQNYAWSGPGNPTNGISFAASMTSNYTVTATDTYGCTGTTTQFVNVIPYVASAMSISISPANARVCAGQAVSMTTIGASAAFWSDGIVDGNLFVPDSSKIYSVIAKDTNGCISALTQKVTVNQLPTLNYTALPGTIVCPGTTITLKGSGSYNYSWSNGVNDGIGFMADSTRLYTYTATDSNGCTNSDNMMVTINPLPSVQALSTSNNGNICAGNSVTLLGSGASTYVWSGGVIDGEPFTPVSDATYTVTGTDAFGCTAQNIITINLNYSTKTVTNLSMVVCEGFTFGNRYLNQSGTYSDTLHNSLGCDSILVLQLTVGVTGDTLKAFAFKHYIFGNDTLTASGTYSHHSLSKIGCDSSTTLILAITQIAGDLNYNNVIDFNEIDGDSNFNGLIDGNEITGDNNGDGSILNGEVAGDINGNGKIDALEVAGDINGNGVIDASEIAGDKNGNRTIDNAEITGDVNGDGVINGTEIAGDINGNRSIDNSEVAGDISGNGKIDGVEIAGDINGNATIDNHEIAGDANGDLQINSNEHCGDINGDGLIMGSEIDGDLNGDIQIDNIEIAGDNNGNGQIDNGEICGDVNGDGTVSGSEKVGDISGNLIIDGQELCGDKNGNKKIDNGEVLGDCSGTAPTPGVVLFTNGISQFISICQDSSSVLLDSLLMVSDTKANENLNWTVVSSPQHGTVNIGSSALSSPANVTPSGYSYIPEKGYNGSDAFTVLISNGGYVAATTIKVLVKALPDVLITGDSTTCSGSPITLVAHGANSFLWNTGSSDSSITDTPVGTVYTYSVIGFSNGCSMTQTKTITIKLCTGIEEVSFEHSLKVYPNPSTGNITLSFTFTTAGKFEVSLKDLNGKLIYSDAKNNFNGQYLSNLDLRGLAAGVYLLQVVSDQGVATRRVLIQ